MALVRSKNRMMTPRQVADDVKRRGYCVSVRQLRDWRERGLLPILKSRGQGRGKGRLSYWDEPRIVQQVIAVHEFVGKRERFTDAHHLEVWFAGYEVDLEKIRAAWLSSLSSTNREWLGGASQKEACEEAIGDLSARLAKQLHGEAWASDAGLGWKRLEPLLHEALNVWFNPRSGVDIAVDQPIVDTVRAIMCRPNEVSSQTEWMTVKNVEMGLQFVHRELSIYAMRRLISAATLKELSLAHKQWSAVLRLVRMLSCKSCGGDVSQELEQAGLRLAAHVGGFCLFGMLALEKKGLGPIVETYLKQAEMPCCSCE